MIRSRCFFLLFVCVTSAATAQIDEAAAGFVAALTASDIAAFDAVAAGDATALPGLAPLREALERYGCIEVASYRTTVLAPNHIRIDLDATATTHGRNHNRVSFPSAWIVDLACDGACRVVSAIRAEEPAAEDLMWRPESDWPSCPIGVDFAEGPFVRELSNRLWQTHDGPTRSRAYDFIMERAAATGDVAVEVWCLGSIALTQRETDKPAATATLRKALEVARKGGDVEGIAGTRFLLGTTLWLSGKAPEGLEELRETSAMIGRLDDPRIALKAMAMRTFISQQIGDLRAALIAANELIAGSRRYGWPQGEAAAGLYLGTLHAAMGDLPAASFYFRGALLKASEIREGRLIAMALENCAIIESASRHYGEAIALARRSVNLGITVNMQEKATFYVRLASYLRQDGRLVEARESLEHARAVISGPHDAEMDAALFNESSELRQAAGDLRGALDDALRGVDAARKGGVLYNTFSPADMYLRAAKAHAALGRDAEAIASLREAVSDLEAARRSYAGEAVASELFMQTGAEAYRMIVDLLVRHGRTREAFEYSERMRGRALGDALAKGKIDVSASMTAAERSKELELERVISDPATAPPARNDARGALDRFETELLLIHPSLRLRRPLANDFRAQMPAKLADGIVVEYVVAPSRMIVFSVTAAGVKAHVIPLSQNAIERRVAKLTSAIARRDYGYAADARSLYTLLLKPVAAELRGKRAVYIIPDGALWRVPFQALLDDSGRSLIESASVSYAPSLTTLRLAIERRHQLQRRETAIAAIGNSSVTEADREVRTIAALYGRSKVDLGSTATPLRFHRDVTGASVVHIAAHAVVDDGAPMYSALMLAPENHNDGALEARAIANLSLQAHTAVLSACETAGGRVGSGEGIIGLSWAFLLAGCPTTVASQWKTSSAPTATLMIDFHRNLIQQSDPAESLRRAELALARDPRYRHPFYWAAFVVMGAP